MVFSILTESYDQHHYLKLQNFFITPKETCTNQQSLPCLPTPYLHH